ncbi:hypothetical protein Rsub_07946 [Raphidocelis subcapitata]|uniref:DOT1 domain-containing protein n=1 Tax=Raphidocelis subcapitata TaxID=307507 RepID=A0A2V0P5T6_9CHLO|nr:hypothetical protein Rsub_07946 [Raphidocelis subcapitata]|eukprot:GBF95231.1 hypothetical protein Rsub_07946 [Raphidocelis subcapitata]
MASDKQQAAALGGLYSIMQTMESKLGGGEGVEGIYGSITATGMGRIFDCMQHNCALDGRSRLVDVGAGLGRPLLHAALRYGLCGAYGVELDPVKVSKAEAFIAYVMRELALRGIAPDRMATPLITRAPVERVESLDPATHAYSFWEGVPRDGKAAFGRLFRTSQTLKAVAVVQRAIRGTDPSLEMQSLGFGPLLLIKSFPVNMSGSGRSFTAYVFSKIAPPSADLLRRQARLSDAAASPAAAPPRQSPAATGMSGARLVQLRTEHKPLASAPSMQAPFAEVALGGDGAGAGAGAGGSPAKRALDAATGAHLAGGEAEGSPSKRRSRDDGGGDQDGAGAAAPERSHSYGLRPKKLDLSRSLSSSGSGSIISTSSDAAACGTATSGTGGLRKSASERSSRAAGERGGAAPAPLQRSASSRGPRAGGKAAAPAAAAAADQSACKPPRGSAARADPAEAVAAPRGGKLRQVALSSMFRQERKAGGANGKPGSAAGASGAAAQAGVGPEAEVC